LVKTTTWTSTPPIRFLDDLNILFHLALNSNRPLLRLFNKLTEVSLEEPQSPMNNTIWAFLLLRSIQAVAAVVVELAVARPALLQSTPIK
jgi:hypothetical protein